MQAMRCSTQSCLERVGSNERKLAVRLFLLI
jgi:hypothetical protein